MKIGRYMVPVWIVSVVLISVIGVGVIFGYVWQTVTIPVQVNEPLKILSYPSGFSMYPGDTEVFNVSIEDDASNNYSVILDFSFGNSTYQANYVTFSDTVYTIVPGQQNITAWFSVNSDAPPTSDTLSISFERVETATTSFFDDFNQTTLNSRWTVIDPYGGSTFSLTSMPSYLTISTTSPPDRDLCQGVNFYSPRIMQPIYGNFTIETKLWAVFNASIQSGGIVIWKDQNNYLRLERAYRYGYQEILFIGTINGTWSVQSPEVSNPGIILNISDINPTYLRLVRTGMVYSGYYSTDDVNWNFLANITMDTDYSLNTGLYNVNRGPPELDSTSFAVSFDYFNMTSEPIVLESSDLIGYWKFDEGSGNVAMDSSGYGNNGTIYGATWVTGKAGYALNFDGSDDYVSIPSFTLPSLTSLTVGAWINSPLTQIGDVFYNGENGEFNLHMGQRPEAGDDNSTLASFSVKFGSTGWIDVFSNPITPNTWHYIVGVWTMGESIKIYVDGVLAGENDAIPNESLYNPGSGYTATVGRYYTLETMSTCFQGSIQGIRVYNRALNDSEISSLFLNDPFSVTYFGGSGERTPYID
jgi:hypothetical protein